MPPPTNEIPKPPHGLESLPLENSHIQFNHLNQFAQALPLIQEPRAVQQFAYHNCGHGPQFQPQLVYGVPAIGGAYSNVQVTGNYLADQGGSASIPAAPEHSPASSYGPPASGNPNPTDSLAFDTQIRTSVSSIIDSENKNDSDGAASGDGKSSSASTSVIAPNDLPGLPSDLNIVSAQKSEGLSIPIKGNLATYQLQFQSADPLAGGDGNSLDHPPHQELLSEGLLQQILNAIEQPGSSKAIQIQQSNSEALNDHKDAKEFINSPAGQEVLADQPKVV